MCAKKKMRAENQQGSSLVEVMIATALVGIMLFSASSLTTKAAATSTDQQQITTAIEQMRASLQDPDICTTAPTIFIPDGSALTAEVQGCGTTSVTIDGTTIDDVPSPLRISVTSDALGGQVVVGGTWVE